jgi:hypothetical protein
LLTCWGPVSDALKHWGDMLRTCGRYAWVWVLVLRSVGGCALPPLANPNVSPTQGVVLGHMQIFADGREVTQECTIGFTDTGPLEIRVRPDAEGWVFASLARGKVRLSSVDCDAKSHMWSLDFPVSGDGRTTYFGHVRLELRRETTSTLSPSSADAIGQGMRAAPPTLAGASAATAVGLVAMLLLGDTEAAGPPAVEVEDKTQEATAAYQARYRMLPKSLVVSLAGSLFSSDPNISSSVQRKGDIIFTEASVSGVRLTWLGVANQDSRKAALRVQRFVRKDTPCSSMKLVLDGRELVLPTASKTERASAMLKQTLQAEMDLQAIRDVAAAKHVLVDVCGTVRAFSALALGATINFANTYATLKAKPAGPPVAAAAVTAPAVSPVAPPAATRADEHESSALTGEF